ncbi:unnamed protein product, partial [Polarella glacialis]
LGRLTPGSVAFLLCDIQERFRDVIDRMPQVIVSAKTMVQGAEIFDVPLLVSEQYPKALGHTVSELNITRGKVFEKTKFSMCTNEFLAHLESLGRKAVVIFGVETHVCVQQTALDLLSRGYQVHILADGVSSQRPMDREFALDRLRQSGCFVTTTESVLFELLRSK